MASEWINYGLESHIVRLCSTIFFCTMIHVTLDTLFWSHRFALLIAIIIVYGCTRCSNTLSDTFLILSRTYI